jgi:hypothetical protein
LVSGCCPNSCHHDSHEGNLPFPYQFAASAWCLVSDYTSEASLFIQDHLVVEFLRCSPSELNTLCLLALNYGPLHYLSQNKLKKKHEHNPEFQHDRNSTSDSISSSTIRSSGRGNRWLSPNHPQSFMQFIKSTGWNFPIHIVCVITRSLPIIPPITPENYDLLKRYSDQLLAGPSSSLDLSTLQHAIYSLGYDRLKSLRSSHNFLWTVSLFSNISLRLIHIDYTSSLSTTLLSVYRS